MLYRIQAGGGYCVPEILGQNPEITKAQMKFVPTCLPVPISFSLFL